MPICLIFIPDTLTADTYLSMVFDESKQMIAPLLSRSIPELRDIQSPSQTHTYLVFPSQLVTLYHLAAPQLPIKKTMVAIHFFLETKLPQSLDHLHIAYQYQKDIKGYLIGVVDKQLIENLFEHCLNESLHFDGIVVDASLLKQGEGLYHDEGLFLMHTSSFHGAVPCAFQTLYENDLHELTCYTHQSLPESSSELMHTQHIEESSYIWLGKRVTPQTGLNLCQGEFRISSYQTRKSLLLWIGLFSLIWLITFLLSQSIQLYRLHQINHTLTTQFTTQYKQLFPQAKLIPHSVFQMSQYLKNEQSVATFWRLIDTLGVVVSQQSCTIETLSFQNNTMTIMVTMQSFKQLEQLTQALKQLGLKVNQLQAVQQDKTIQSTLELT